TVIGVAPSEFRGDEVFPRQGKNLAIKIIDHQRKKQKAADYPSEVSHSGIRRCGWHNLILWIVLGKVNVKK
ncbi:MAG: hypothetical protein K2G59_00600, partial [Muribaculaceae bacterium]|nr:hypothetical protein [Muribaculaceae bacterium]